MTDMTDQGGEARSKREREGRGRVRRGGERRVERAGLLWLFQIAVSSSLTPGSCLERSRCRVSRRKKALWAVGERPDSAAAAAPTVSPDRSCRRSIDGDDDDDDRKPPVSMYLTKLMTAD